jgi:uncharacterized YccA/Bax inhibitor family protein
MSNPVLGRAFGGDQPAVATAGVDTAMAAQGLPTTGSPVVVDTMTIGGVTRATGLMLVVLLAGAFVGWNQVTASDPPQLPGFILPAMLVGFGLAIAGTVRPQWARFVGPLYAATQGFVLGAISRVYEFAWEGIVLQAVLATIATTIVMVVLFATRTIRVTDKMRSVIIGATLALALFYLASLVLSLFGATMPLVWDSGLFGILFSVAVVALAAFNLLLDFDLIERGVAARAPAHYDWFAALGLMVTLVWLYLEILRLLARTRD